MFNPFNEAIRTTILICVCYSFSVFLTPGLRFDDFELRSCGCLVVFSDLSPHAETQSHHVVLLAVARQTTLDVVQQSRLQPDVLSHTDAHTHTHRHAHAHTHAQTQTHTRTHADTHRHRHRHRHTHRRAHTHADTHRHRHTDRHTHTHTRTQADTDTHTHTHADRHTHAHTDTHTHTHADRHTHFQIWMDIYLRSWEIQQNNDSTFFFSIWSNDAVNSALITGIKSHLNLYSHRKVFRVYTLQILPFSSEFRCFFLANLSLYPAIVPFFLLQFSQKVSHNFDFSSQFRLFCNSEFISRNFVFIPQQFWPISLYLAIFHL